MPKEEPLVLDGHVVEAVKNGFRVQLNDSPHVVYSTLCGSMRRNFIRVVPGDRVRVEVSPYDYARGRIVHREK